MAISFPRLRRWLRFARFTDSFWILCRTHIGVTLEDIGETIGSNSGTRKKPNRVQLEIQPLEERAFPGQTVGMLGWGMIGTGLSLIDRSLSQPPSIQRLGSLDADGAEKSHVSGYGEEASKSSSSSGNSPLPSGERVGVTGTSTSESSLSSSPSVPVSPSSPSPDPAAPNAAAYPFFDPLTDPFVDVLSGESLRASRPSASPTTARHRNFPATATAAAMAAVVAVVRSRLAPIPARHSCRPTPPSTSTAPRKLRSPRPAAPRRVRPHLSSRAPR